MKQAVVFYCSPKITSNYTFWALESVGGKPLLGLTIEGLQCGLPNREFAYFVLCHDEGTVKALSAKLVPGVIKIYQSGATNKTMVLADFAKEYRDHKNLLVYPENSLFPDAVLSAKMLRHHIDREADATGFDDFPKGYLPEIYSNQALRRLAGLGLPDDAANDPLAVMKKSNQLFAGDVSMTFRVGMFNASLADKSEADLAVLPSKLLLENGLMQSAAERTLSSDRPVLEYKKALVDVESQRCFSFPVLPDAAKRIPVLYSTQFGAFSGAEESFSLLISHVDRSIYAPIVLLEAPNRLSDKLSQAGVHVEFARFDFTKQTPYVVAYLNALLEHFKIRLVHVNVLAGTPLASAAFQKKIPVITHIRTYPGREAAEELKFSTHLIAISESVAQNVRQSDVHPQKVSCIYNGLDLKEFDPSRYEKAALRAQLDIPLDAFVLTHIARVCPQKRQDFLVKALPALVVQIPELHILFVGEAYAEDLGYLQHLKAAIEGNKLSQKVRFMGFSEKIAQMHAVSNAITLCTHREPFGRSILEAMAMRIPVILPETGGFCELVQHEKNGLLYPSEDIARFQQEVLKIRNNPTLTRFFVDNARKTLETFSIQNHVHSVQRLYASLLN